MKITPSLTLAILLYLLGAGSPAIADPAISFLNPTAANVNWQGTVRIFGNNFNNQCFVFFDNDTPVITQTTPTYIDVSVTTRVTAIAGDKPVKVHDTTNGTLSNEVTFSVR